MGNKLDQSQHSCSACLTYRVKVGDPFSLKDRDGNLFAPSGGVAGSTEKHWRRKRTGGRGGEETKELRKGREE